MNTRIVIVVGILVLAASVAAGVYIYSPAQQGGIVEHDGLYSVGAKTLGAGYIRENGGIFYTTRLQYYTGTSLPAGVRYDKFAVAGADLATFSLMTDAPSENNESVYYQWAKDKQNVFYQGDAIRPAATSTRAIDISTFSVISSSYYAFGRDKDTVYEITSRSGADNYWAYAELLGVDPATFTFVGETCAKDKNSFYTIGYYGEFAATPSTPVPAQCTRPGPGEGN